MAARKSKRSTSSSKRKSTKAKSKSTKSGKGKSAEPQPEGGGWVAPTAIGLAALFGVGFLARRASAKSSDAGEQQAEGADGPVFVPDSPATTDDIVFPVYRGEKGAYMLQELLKVAGVDLDWRRFFLATARQESGFVSNVVLGDPKLYPPGSQPSPLTDKLGKIEAAGARTAYERGLKQGRYEGCPWPAEAYSWGSGGWLGMLPANAWYPYRNTSLRCRHPWYLLHPVDHVVVAIEFARGLTGWRAFKENPTWLTLRVGWGNPSKMDDQARHEAVGFKFGKQLEALGIPHGFMHKKVTPLPGRDVEGTWDTLMRTFDLEPGKTGA